MTRSSSCVTARSRGRASKGRTYVKRASDEAPEVLQSDFLGDEGTIALSPDCRYLCTGDDMRLVVWGLETSSEHLRTSGTSPICQFTQDSRAIMVYLDKRELKLIPLDMSYLDRPADKLLREAQAAYPLDVDEG